MEGAWIEASQAEEQPVQVVQLEREVYFVAHRHEQTQDGPVFNRTIGQRDTWNEGKN
mgnify:CR=1 FL=1